MASLSAVEGYIPNIGFSFFAFIVEFKLFEKSLEALKHKILGRTRAFLAFNHLVRQSLGLIAFLGSSRKRIL